MYLTQPSQSPGREGLSLSSQFTDKITEARETAQHTPSVFLLLGCGKGPEIERRGRTLNSRLVWASPWTAGALNPGVRGGCHRARSIGKLTCKIQPRVCPATEPAHRSGACCWKAGCRLPLRGAHTLPAQLTGSGALPQGPLPTLNSAEVREGFLQSYMKTLLFCRQSSFSKKVKTASAHVQQEGVKRCRESALGPPGRISSTVSFSTPTFRSRGPPSSLGTPTEHRGRPPEGK